MFFCKKKPKSPEPKSEYNSVLYQLLNQDEELFELGKNLKANKAKIEFFASNLESFFQYNKLFGIERSFLFSIKYKAYTYQQQIKEEEKQERENLRKMEKYQNTVYSPGSLPPHTETYKTVYTTPGYFPSNDSFQNFDTNFGIIKTGTKQIEELTNQIKILTEKVEALTGINQQMLNGKTKKRV